MREKERGKKGGIQMKYIFTQRQNIQSFNSGFNVASEKETKINTN